MNTLPGGGDVKNRGFSMNICADCKRYMGCPWEIEGRPVPGWTARPTKVKLYAGGYGDSFEIIACPLFIPPDDTYQLPEAFEKSHPGRAVRKLRAVNLETGEVREYTSLRGARRDGFGDKSVVDCLSGKREHIRGWKFEFL